MSLLKDVDCIICATYLPYYVTCLYCVHEWCNFWILWYVIGMGFIIWWSILIMSPQ